MNHRTTRPTGQTGDQERPYTSWLAAQLDVAIYEAEPGGQRRIRYASPPFARSVGYAADELESDQGLERLVHPADRQLATEALAAAADAGERRSAEYRLVARDGRILRVRDQCECGHDPDGHILIRGYLRDVTEESLASEELSESQTRIRLLSEQLPAVVWSVDPEGSLTSLFGRGAAHLRLGDGDFPGPDTAEPHQRALAGERVDFEVEWGGRTFEAHVEPLDRAGGANAGVIGIATDVTERRRIADLLRSRERQLETARKMEALGRLAGGVAHDFNNLLTSILGNAHLLAEGLEPDDPRRDEAERIGKVAERGAALVKQLLGFASRQALQPRVVDLNTLVTGMQAMLGRLMGATVGLEMALDPTSPRVWIDPAALEQIVMNLVLNARDATPRGGTVTITTLAGADESGERTVAVSVSDTGHGIDEATRARMFEPFFTTKERRGGTGLGLAIVHGIVAQSGGTISVDSEPGGGARFRVAFPASVDSGDRVDRVDRVAGINPTASEPTGAIGSETILLVEDDDDVRLFAQRALELSGYAVIEARSGEEAITAWHARPTEIDLLLSDVILPGIDGISAARLLAGERPAPTMLMITGFMDDEEHDGLLAELEMPVLRKPFTPEALVREVRAVLDAAGGAEDHLHGDQPPSGPAIS